MPQKVFGFVSSENSTQNFPKRNSSYVTGTEKGNCSSTPAVRALFHGGVGCCSTARAPGSGGQRRAGVRVPITGLDTGRHAHQWGGRYRPPDGHGPATRHPEESPATSRATSATGRQ